MTAKGGSGVKGYAGVDGEEAKGIRRCGSGVWELLRAVPMAARHPNGALVPF